MSEFINAISDSQIRSLNDYIKANATTNDDERVVVFDDEEYDRT